MPKNNVKREKAFLVGVILQGTCRSQIDEQLNELKFLADTAGAKISDTIIQKKHCENAK